ncbi:restriction endonuclease subunit S [Providencia stuartii]|uniref:restriction endonuclease subunit S n=1 Tax=Providencia stuartii TaxID=588 RepID=UPI0018C4BB98|nr:restriction endonuclease subunit S [Providencia stuartii]MBG5898582.1 restriction endonuclease subunit S [Providencia stuartii]MCX3072191.1 restriction endonuclease subunit S [Providencia stuartii]
MAKDKMNIPQIRFKGFEGEWNNRIIDGVIQLRSEVGNQEYFTVDIELENLVSNLGVIVGDTTVRTQANSLFRSGDILFGRLRPYLNKWWLANTDGVKSGEIWALYPKSEGSNRFIYSLIQTEKFLTYVNLTSGTKMPRADWSVIKNHSIDIPKLNEQTQIGDFFQKIDQVIELQQQKVEQSERYKKAMLQKMFPQKGEKVPRVRFAGFSGDWIGGFIADILVVNSGKDYKHLERGNIPVFGTGGYMLSVNKALSNEDAIGLGRKGTINKPQYLRAPFWTVDTLFYLTAKPFVKINFSYYLLQEINWLKYDESTGVPSLSKRTIEKVKVFYPSLDEQIQIGKFFQKLDQQIEQQAQKLATYQQLKKAILQRMFV